MLLSDKGGQPHAKGNQHKERANTTCTGEDHPGTSHPIPGKVRRAVVVGSPAPMRRGGRRSHLNAPSPNRGVFRPFAWLEAGSVKVASPRPAPPDRACRDHQYPAEACGAYPAREEHPRGRYADASRWAVAYIIRKDKLTIYKGVVP